MSKKSVGDPRRVAAILANPDMRFAYAQAVLGHRPEDIAAHLSPARRKKILSALVDSGLLRLNEDGTVSDSEEVFHAMLALHPTPVVATGVSRFLRDERILQYPANTADRRELLVWVAGKALHPHETLDEREINERLKRFTEEYAVLRRYLVDADLLERTTSGTAYRRTSMDDRLTLSEMGSS